MYAGAAMTRVDGLSRPGDADYSTGLALYQKLKPRTEQLSGTVYEDNEGNKISSFEFERTKLNAPI